MGYLTVALLAGGCSKHSGEADASGVVDGPDADADVGRADAGRVDTVHAGSAPRILSFATNVTRITETEAVSFMAMVTDPDGIDDLIGGSLLSVDGKVTYGSFATAAQEGSYTLSLDWSAVNKAQPAQFATEEARVFTARFYDQAGHSTEAKATVTLHCNGISACAGVCTTTSTDNLNCGACGHICPGALSCKEGACRATVCVKEKDLASSPTCAAACTKNQLLCGPCLGQPTLVGMGANTTFCMSNLPGPTPAPSPASCGEKLSPTSTTSVACCCLAP